MLEQRSLYERATFIKRLACAIDFRGRPVSRIECKFAADAQRLGLRLQLPEQRAARGCDPSVDSAAGKAGAASVAPKKQPFWRESDKSQEREGSALAII